MIYVETKRGQLNTLLYQFKLQDWLVNCSPSV